MRWLRRWAPVGTIALAVFTIAFGIAVYLAPPAVCEPVFSSPNRLHGLDLAYLKGHNHHTSGSVALDAAAVKSLFVSHDPRNFAVEVSVGEYGAAFGLPATDAQNIFYGHDLYRNDPSRRVVLAFSRGDFEWKFTGDTAASGSANVHLSYRVAMGAVDAQSGSVIVDQTPACK
jgi:hypothetical protein